MFKTAKLHFSKLELVILDFLVSRHSSNPAKVTAEITEIASGIGVRDADEVLRALYTLEGKSLVSPEPRGDFTSNQWIITEVGLRAIDVLRPSLLQGDSSAEESRI